jgi:hypothetical protein
MEWLLLMYITDYNNQYVFKDRYENLSDCKKSAYTINNIKKRRVPDKFLREDFKYECIEVKKISK